MLQKSICTLIIHILIVYKYCVLTKYCIVNSNNSAIYINSTLGRQRTYPVSTTLYTKLLSNFAENSLNNWQNRSSIGDNEINYKLGPVLDQRWEIFQPFIDYNELMPGYYSIKIYDGELDRMFSQCKRQQWCHVYMNNSKEDLIQLYKHQDIIKIHNYNYAYTSNRGETQIYKSTDDSGGFGCIFLFLAMCNSCRVIIKVINGNNQIVKLENFVNSNNTTNWQRIELCLIELPQNYRLFIITDNDSDDNSGEFWAIDRLYYSSCKNDKRFMEVLCENNLRCNCEDVYNRNYEIFDDLPEDCRKIETTTTTTITTAVTTISTTIIENNFNADISTEIELSTEQFQQINETNREKNEQQYQANLYYLLILIAPLIIIFVIIFLFCKYRDRCLSDQSDGKKCLDSIEINLIDDTTTTVECNEFEKYLKDAFDPNNTTVDLFQQFQALPVDYSRSHAIGLLAENSNKNKSPQIVPYDDNRAILTKILPNGEQRDDYINASFINGICPNEYIAAQDPLKTTIEDFWYMIWQENIEIIATITTKNQRDFLQYWPDFNQTTTVNDIAICFIKITEFEYFKCREFIVTKHNTQRKVLQYHFTCWSISDDQMFSYLLVPFIKELLEIPRQSGPILVHSESGIGRTALAILCDIILRSSQNDNRIDIYGIVNKLRTYRVNMIDNFNLYKLAHLVILECLQDTNMVIDVNEKILNDNRILLESNNFVNKQWKYSEECRWIDEQSVAPEQISNYLTHKNRYENILPLKHSRVVLKHITPDYINATRVDGYRQFDKFIVTQQPLKQTLVDFWIMILQNNATIIVNLNQINLDDDISCQFWPIEAKLKPMPDVIIEYRTKIDHLHFEKYTITIEDHGKKRRDITVINMKDWGNIDEMPANIESLLNICQVVREAMITKTTAVVTCNNGLTASGLFVGLIYILDKIDHRKECDIVGAVRMLRRSHYGFITYKQFVFLYKYRNCDNIDNNMIADFPVLLNK